MPAFVGSSVPCSQNGFPSRVESARNRAPARLDLIENLRHLIDAHAEYLDRLLAPRERHIQTPLMLHDMWVVHVTLAHEIAQLCERDPV